MHKSFDQISTLTLANIIFLEVEESETKSERYDFLLIVLSPPLEEQSLML